jgi:hypothetical protein
MLNRMLNAFRRRPVAQPTAFEPLYSLEQLAVIARLPVIRIEPIATAQSHSDEQRGGPGAAGVITNLLRRNLLLSRQVSVIGIEDTGILTEALPDGTIEVIPDFESCDIVVRGRLRALDGTMHSLQLQILRGEREPEQFSIRFDERQLVEMLVRVSGELARRLGIKPTAAMQADWEANLPTGWTVVCLAGVCWEQADWPRLLAFAQQHRIHADALCGMSREDGSPLTQAAYAFGASIDHTNPQLLFFHFIAIWKGRNQPRAADLLRRSLLAAPGHGKSQMCLPHVTPITAESTPYVLAHSRAAYRLLRGNSFALNNYSNYLQNLSPGDPQIFELLRRAIELDPLSPLGYADAIDYLLAQGRPREALQYARQLAKICTPPAEKRTEYCLRQVPALAARMDRGELTVSSYAAAYVARCERALAGG